MRTKVTQEDYDFLVSLLPPAGATTPVEEFREKYNYELGRNNAINDSKNIRFLKHVISNFPAGLPDAYRRGYCEYGKAFLVINRHLG